jgi:hypothetical protein
MITKININPTISQTLSKIILPIGLKKGIGKSPGNFHNSNEYSSYIQLILLIILVNLEYISNPTGIDIKEIKKLLT